MLNAAYEGLPNADMTPREAYERLVADDVESVPVDNLANRTAANAIMPYPPGIPMLMSGENFGGANSPQIGYLRSMQNRERAGRGGTKRRCQEYHGASSDDKKSQSYMLSERVGCRGWQQFPGFAGVIEGAELVDGTYHVLCVKV